MSGTKIMKAPQLFTSSNPPSSRRMKVKFKRFIFGEGYTWKAGGEGIVIAETETFYKVRTWLWFSEWVYKTECEEIRTSAIIK